MSAETLARTIGSAPEVIEGIKSGLYTVWGGVVRVSAGQPGGGQIIGHLQFPGDAAQAAEQMTLLQKTLEGVQGSLGMLQSLQCANLALSGLNLAVTVAGFVIVCRKLNGISEQLNSQSEKLDVLIEMAQEARVREELRDSARFSATLKTVQHFAETGDVQQLKNQVGNLHEQYEITKLMLLRAAENVKDKRFIQSLGVLDGLQKRMMYLGFILSYVQQRTAGEKYAVRVLKELEDDWNSLNAKVIESISGSRDWIENLSQADGDNIISFLEYRKAVAPAIEYQINLLEFTSGKPEVSALMNDEIGEIRFIAA